MADITAKFREKDLLVPKYIADGEMKKMRYPDMLHDDIWEFVSLLSCKSLEDMIAISQEWEIYLKLMRK